MSEQIKEVHGCEVCGNGTLREVLDLGRHPMCDDLVPIGDTRTCIEYPISILFCDTCITAHQRYQIPKRLLFPRSYHYRARHTADVLSGMQQLVAACEIQLGSLAGKSVLDVGCNDGSLLSFFAMRAARTFGIEPTGAAEDSVAAGHIVVNDFLSTDVARAFVEAHGHPDLITFTNVFAHIENLSEVIESLKILAGRTTALMIENHYLGAIVDRYQFDTFYHEHPRTYSFTSFQHIARLLGMHVSNVEFPSRYGGNIRVLLMPGNATSEHTAHSPIVSRERQFGAGLEGLMLSVQKWRQCKGPALLAETAVHGALPAKAFPGRAAILIKLLGLDNAQITAVYEKPTSNKVGHYVPGTRIPILSDDDFVASEAPLLNLAWHIPTEIRSYMAQRGYVGKIIDILSEDDF